MDKAFSKIEKYIIASDVSTRDGIGIEVYSDETIIMEIFRDDTKKTNEITIYQKDLDLELVEQAINLFKSKIPNLYQN